MNLEFNLLGSYPMYCQSRQLHLYLDLLRVICSDTQDNISPQLDLIDDILVFQSTCSISIRLKACLYYLLIRDVFLHYDPTT